MTDVAQPVKEPAVASGPPPREEWVAAVSEYRSTVKWIIGAFGAVAAVLVGTAPLTGLASIPSDRVRLVAISYGAALVGVLLVVLAAVRVLNPVAIYPGSLRPRRRPFGKFIIGAARLEDEIHRRPASFLPSGITSVPDLDEAIVNLELIAETLSVEVGRAAPDQRPIKMQALKDAQERLKNYGEKRRAILGLARYERSRTRMTQALLTISIASLLTGIAGALVLFGIQAKPENKSSSVVLPKLVSVLLTEQGTKTLAPLLGVDCVATPILGVMVSEDSGGHEILVRPTTACPAARFILTDTLGTTS